MSALRVVACVYACVCAFMCACADDIAGHAHTGRHGSLPVHLCERSVRAVLHVGRNHLHGPGRSECDLPSTGRRLPSLTSDSKWQISGRLRWLAVFSGLIIERLSITWFCKALFLHFVGLFIFSCVLFVYFMSFVNAAKQS